MADLSFCFTEKKEERNLTVSEINDITMAAQGIHAIIKVMNEYAINNQQDKDDDALGIYSSVFNVLDLLMDPIRDYLSAYAGSEAAPEKKSADTQRKTV